MRLIDADDLIEQTEAEAEHIDNLIVKMVLYAIIADIENVPTATERKRGENISKDGFLCSLCGFGDFGGFHAYEPNFCPNCGADMRGGGESDQ